MVSGDDDSDDDSEDDCPPLVTSPEEGYFDSFVDQMGDGTYPVPRARARTHTHTHTHTHTSQESESSDSGSDSEMTDEANEREIVHDEAYIKWTPSKAWLKKLEKGKLNAFEQRMAAAEWRAPSKREDVPTLDTGPEQDIVFVVDTTRAAEDLILEALPIDSFWEPVAKRSERYCREERAKAGNEATARYVDYKWFTAANYIRLFAAVQMRGLVNARDDEEFFRGFKNGDFERTGAQQITDLTINIYQQLLRFMHLVDNKDQRGPEDPEFDKLFKVRPLISRLQYVFMKWIMTPSKDNALDEAGFSSRHPWMRTFNPTKPNKYFMEMLLACDRKSRYCWGFIVTEHSKKSVPNRHRDPNARSMAKRSKYMKVEYYQREYNAAERSMQLYWGPATAQMMYFARLVRSFQSPSTYRFFTDRRWDSMPAIIMAMTQFKVSFTTTVKASSRYYPHNYWITEPNKVLVKSKRGNKRGKYRSATTTIDGVTLNICMWNDSSLCRFVSADLGTEDCPVKRQVGRHSPFVSCPKMVNDRADAFRSVDVHDQKRMCKWKMVFICRKKAWPHMTFKAYELLVVNVYIIKCVANPTLCPRDFRWECVHGLVRKAREYERLLRERERNARGRRSGRLNPEPQPTPTSQREEGVPRLQGAYKHHHDRLQEYVTPEEAEINARIVEENPNGSRVYNRRPRARDQHRRTVKVRNPLFTSASACLVCKWQFGKRVETLRYCRECCVDKFAGWPSTNRARGFAKEFHPRLCSKKCFIYFHTHNIKGLDYGRKRKRSKGSRGARNRRRVASTDTSGEPSVASEEQTDSNTATSVTESPTVQNSSSTVVARTSTRNIVTTVYTDPTSTRYEV